jgi:hypothetical protein
VLALSDLLPDRATGAVRYATQQQGSGGNLRSAAGAEPTRGDIQTLALAPPAVCL